MSVSAYSYSELVKDKLKREYEIVIDDVKFSQLFGVKLAHFEETASVPGFRPGKGRSKTALYKAMVRQRYGSKAIERAVDELVDETSKDFMSSNGFDNVIAPSLTITSVPALDNGDLSDGKGLVDKLVYKIAFEIVPKVALVDLGKIKIKKLRCILKDSDLLDDVNRLRENAVKFVEVDSEYKSQLGDKVIIDFEGRLNGKSFKGGSGANVPVVIGQNRFIADFEQQLSGVMTSETKKMICKFPDEYPEKKLAGCDVEFTVTVREIRQGVAVDGDEDLAKSQNFENFDALLADLKRKREGYCVMMENVLVKKELLDKLDELYIFDVPTSIVQEECEKIRAEGYEKKDDELSKEADRRVRLGMLLMEFGKVNKINVSHQDILDFVNDHYVSKGMRLDKVIQLMRSNKRFLDLIHGQILEVKVIEDMLGKVDKEILDVPLADLDSAFYDVEKV